MLCSNEVSVSVIASANATITEMAKSSARKTPAHRGSRVSMSRSISFGSVDACSRLARSGPVAASPSSGGARRRQRHDEIVFASGRTR
jgi:hypothetical protein